MSKKISTVYEKATEAFEKLKKLQTGKEKLVKTGYEAIDCHLDGLLPSDVIVIAGNSGTGKTETLYKMIDRILSTDINKDAENFASLEFSLEMPMLNKLIRKISSELGIKKGEVISKEFSEDQRKLVIDYYMSLKDSRRLVVDTPTTPLEFKQLCTEFCEERKDKDALFISLDHSLLLKIANKQEGIEQLADYINELRGEFKNVYFIILTQLNRSSLGVVKEKSNEMRPLNSWIYGSSVLEHLASYIVIITNPFKQGIDNYLKVNSNRYEYLEEHFTDEDSKGRVSFDTTGKLFYFVTKMRESDYIHKDLFIEKMRLSPEQMKMLEMRKKDKEIVDVNNFPDIPDFSEDIPVFSAEEAFD